VALDFAGTLVKPEVVEEANEFRAEVLEREVPGEDEYGDSEELYENNREAVEQLTGVKEHHNVRNRETLGEVELKGKEYQNVISTDLFRIGMLKAAEEHDGYIFQEGIREALEQLSEEYTIAVFSGVRTDIITALFKITGIRSVTYVLGQPPQLGVSNNDHLEELMREGSLEHIIGDNIDDLEVGKEYGAETVFVEWGHESGGEKDVADQVVKSPEELVEEL